MDLGAALAEGGTAEAGGDRHANEVDDGMRAATGGSLDELECVVARGVDDLVRPGLLRRRVLGVVRLRDDDLAAGAEDLGPADA